MIYRFLSHRNQYFREYANYFEIEHILDLHILCCFCLIFCFVIISFVCVYFVFVFLYNFSNIPRLSQLHMQQSAIRWTSHRTAQQNRLLHAKPKNCPTLKLQSMPYRQSPPQTNWTNRNSCRTHSKPAIPIWLRYRPAWNCSVSIRWPAKVMRSNRVRIQRGKRWHQSSTKHLRWSENYLADDGWTVMRFDSVCFVFRFLFVGSSVDIDFVWHIRCLCV